MLTELHTHRVCGRRRAKPLASASLVAALAIAAALSSAPGQAQTCLHPDTADVFALPGDLNGSGAINVADALCAIQHVLLWPQIAQGAPPHPCLAGPIQMADLNCDGVIDTEDLVLTIRRATVGVFPDEVDATGRGCPDTCAFVPEAGCPAGTYPPLCAACPQPEGCAEWTCTDGTDSVCSSCASGWFPDGDGCTTTPAEPVKLDLSGGPVNNQATYSAPNGTVVTSSAPTYSNSTFYFLGYLFDESYGTAPDEYWLTNSTGNRTLTFAFDQPYDVAFVRVYPTTISDRKSNYRIEVNDGGTWTDITGLVVTTSDPAGFYRDHSHPLLTGVTQLRFVLTREASWGVTLTEVEFYVIPDP